MGSRTNVWQSSDALASSQFFMAICYDHSNLQSAPSRNTIECTCRGLWWAPSPPLPETTRDAKPRHYPQTSSNDTQRYQSSNKIMFYAVQASLPREILIDWQPCCRKKMKMPVKLKLRKLTRPALEWQLGLHVPGCLVPHDEARGRWRGTEAGQRFKLQNLDLRLRSMEPSRGTVHGEP